MGTPIKVMVVDDEERFRVTLAKLLGLKGMDVRCCASAVEALEELAKDKPDVILLDVKMPGLSGVDALPEIKKIDPLAQVIVLTGHASVDVAAEIMTRGGSDYVLKPCPVDELAAKIIKAFERRQTQLPR